MTSSAHNSEASTSNFLIGAITSHQNNSKYRAYASAVDKALKSFESTTEWADLIAALGKLGKVFASNTKFGEIPNALTVAKRLSQCLHPALPSGVHLKALETYRQVFNILGQPAGRNQNLAKFLHLYAIGLFPLMDHCGIKVKSELLSIFEQYMLPLGADLRPALLGFITAVLLALEEGTEFYLRAFQLLDQLIEKVGSDAFYTCFWQAVGGSSPVRLPALMFINAKLERQKAPQPSGETIYALSGGSQASNHMLRSLCAVAEDSGSALVQRHLLDFLCATIQLDAEWVPQPNLVQLLRRTMFVVLRRDISLNRRLYQWLLNHSNDVGFAGLPVNGTEDSMDLAFFRKHTLPLIKLAIRDYLNCSETVEVPPLSTGTIRRYGTLLKDPQIQFPEVRICRLLHYMLDRPELGQLVLEESLADLLETICLRDVCLIQELQRDCEQMDATFNSFWDVSMVSGKSDGEQMARRGEEIRKNLNVLLNALDPSFIWGHLRKLFVSITQKPAEKVAQEKIDRNTFSLRSDDWQFEHKDLKTLFPVMVAFCIKNVQLDSHGDIRGRHLPALLQSILQGICAQEHFSLDNQIAIVVLCRRLLAEMTQNNLSMVFESIQQQDSSTENSPSKKGVKCNKELAEEQHMVECCLSACLELLSAVCGWYAAGRERDKIGVLCGLTTLVRDFADFPFYSLQPMAAATQSAPESPCRSLTESLRGTTKPSAAGAHQQHLPEWLSAMVAVIDAPSWHTTADAFDFDMRSRLFDLVLYLCVRSASMIEQHAAVCGRAKSTRDENGAKSQKTTTTVLLKPFLSKSDLNKISKEDLYKKAAAVLWKRFSENTETARLQSVALLLLRLHSRRASDSSSDVEDIILADLTSANKVVSGEAARKFRDLWVFCRSSLVNEVYSGIVLKPMNRVVMVLLGFISDDKLGAEQVELRALAYSWLLDCAHHNDLHRLLQMLTLMLLNPATARVSIQFVQMRKRITREQLHHMPPDANCVVLTTMSGRQTFHHVCRDVERMEVTHQQHPLLRQHSSSWHATDAYINCDSRQQWVSDLSRQLLLPSSSNDTTNATTIPSCNGGNNALFAQNPLSGVKNAQQQSVAQTSCVNQQSLDASCAPGGAVGKTHRRTMSDIPQFDQDAESMDSYSLDASLDQEVVDVVQFLVDSICEVYEAREDEEEDEEENAEIPDELSNDETTLNSSRGFNIVLSAKREDVEMLGKKRSIASRSATNVADERIAAMAQEADEVSVVGSLVGPASTAAALPRISSYGGGDTIRRIRTGHRRQDSLQESIFSTGTQELRLFDPAELPNSTCPGDYKQPLLDETFSHMLFYAESPSIVDLGRAEKLFRTIHRLLKSGNGIGRYIVSSMLFTNMAAGRDQNAKSTIGGANTASAQQLVEYMTRHYRHMQGEGFWTEDDGGQGEGEAAEGGNKGGQQKQSTLFETFTSVVLYFFRSYYLNSPTNYVSEEDLVLSWKCKIAALDCFTELLRLLDEMVREASSKEFATFVQQLYRQTKTQKVVLTLMLAAIPTPPSQKGWKMPLAVDIADFNNGPHKNGQFRDLMFAYQRSLLSIASALVILEYDVQVGTRNYAQSPIGLSGATNFVGPPPLTENQINYNSSQNRSTIRDARYSVVELRLFLGVILNALKRCPERHELWLQFLVGILPYLDRALATFVVHSVEQICRNLYECAFLSSTCSGGSSSLNTPLSAQMVSVIEHPKSPVQYVDYRIGRTNEFAISPTNTTSSVLSKYPANYILIMMESLMSTMHFCLLDGNSYSALAPQFLVSSRHTASSFAPQPSLSSSNLSPSRLSQQSAIASSGGGTFSSSNMTSMVGSAISVIPGTGLIKNLFGPVFTSGENPSNATARSDTAGKSPEWMDAQRELIKRLPSAVAILSDVWTYTTGREHSHDAFVAASACCTYPMGAYNALSLLVLDILNPIAKKHQKVLINSLGIVWMFRNQNGGAKSMDINQCSFEYSSQQISVAKLTLNLKAYSLNSVILAVSETLKEAVNKAKTTAAASGGSSDKAFSVEVALLELLHECTRQVSVGELRDSWTALSILFNESPLLQLPARASFLEFIILTDFVRRCGSQAVIEDKQISKAILDVVGRLIEAINVIVGWQLESTTWLKRTLVVRQDASTQKMTSSDLSPLLEQKTVSMGGSMAAPLSASALTLENNSMRGSTVSLSGIPPSRLSSAVDGQCATVGGLDSRKGNASSASLRSSIKESGVVANKKDPLDSTQALFLLAENLTELIDSVCKSEDKEKLLPALQAVWNNTLPYLKSKSAKNVRFFLASSQFLASMSSYNYMRTVWKKNAMELLWDNSFFKMDIHALRQWLIAIDNLMTNDKTSFKELLARITTSTSTTLSTLITSKEQEYEMRAQYLKRLAFVILSSDLDQYSGQLNEIQERLTENLRLCQVPIIHTQVFTCYRVLLVRMSPSSFVSIWPSMVTELVQVLAQVDHQLSSANTPSLDEQRSLRDEQCMQLYLAACKLLETFCTLPSGYVSQFQMCRWTFVSPTNVKSVADVFVPYAFRLNHLLNIKYSELTNEDLRMRSASLFNIKTLTSYQELHPFFHALTIQNGHQATEQMLQNGETTGATEKSSPAAEGARLRDESQLNGSLSLKSAVARIEHSLYVDFAEHWQL